MEKQYRSGFERYQDIVKIIKQQCCNLEGKTVENYGAESTLYEWNGYKVLMTPMAGDDIVIYDKDDKVFLSYYEFGDLECQFGLNSSQFEFAGVYFPKLSDSYLHSKYQNLESHLASDENEHSDINLLPDDITIMVQEEIKRAEEVNDSSDEHSINYNGPYIEQLKMALDFFQRIQELAKDEKAIEGPTEDLSYSQPTGAERIIEFMEQNNLEPHDLSLALSMVLARTTDRANAEQHIISEVDKNKENPENVHSEH